MRIIQSKGAENQGEGRAREPNHGPAELVEEAERGGGVGRPGHGAPGGGLPFADEVVGDVRALHGRERHGIGATPRWVSADSPA